jgi:hypothetical protein
MSPPQQIAKKAFYEMETAAFKTYGLSPKTRLLKLKQPDARQHGDPWVRRSRPPC